VVGFPSLVLTNGAAYMEITVTEVYDNAPDCILELGWRGSNTMNHHSGDWRNFISIFRQNINDEDSEDPPFFSVAHQSVESTLFLMSHTIMACKLKR
jgi:hypothetical protein